MHCEAEGIALALMGSDEAGVSVILLGDQDGNLGIDRACVVAAHIMLGGIITGAWHERNEEQLKEIDKPIPKENLN